MQIPQCGAKPAELLWRKPVFTLLLLPQRPLLQMEDLAEVNQRMPRHDKRQLRLPRRRSFDHRDEQGAGVENCCDRRKPTLVVMLRSVVAEDGIRDVRLQNLR